MTRVDSRLQTSFRQNVWVLPIAAVLVAVMIMSVPPFLAFDPATVPVPLNENVPALDYVLTTAHVMLSVVALVSLCLGIWPWLRIRHPAVHRWNGRVYVFCSLCASLVILPIVVLGGQWQADLGAAAIGVFWFVTTLIGYIAIRQGNQVKHRRWMLYSFAMAMAVVWAGVLTPLLLTTIDGPYLMELVRWVGPLINLIAVKWWLDRTATRAAVVRLHTGSRRDHGQAYRRAA